MSWHADNVCKLQMSLTKRTHTKIFIKYIHSPTVAGILVANILKGGYSVQRQSLARLSS